MDTSALYIAPAKNTELKIQKEYWQGLDVSEWHKVC